MAYCVIILINNISKIMINLILNRFENDIKNTYENLYGQVNTNDNIEISKASQICNNVLIDICQSYYFQNKYSLFKLMDIKDKDGNLYNYISSPIKNDNSGLVDDLNNKHIYLIRNGVFFNSINNLCNMLDSSFNTGNELNIITSANAIKDKLKEDPFYHKIFETNPIKQSLELKNKKDFSISVFENGMKVEDFSKIIKEQEISNNKDLQTYLKFSCGINFVDIEKQKDNTFFVIHNDEDIVGLGSLMNNPFLNELNNNDKFKYLSFIAVSTGYRGNGVGLEISDNIMKHCYEKGFIYERSGATRDGSIYMESKIDQASNKYEGNLPIIKEAYADQVREYIKSKFKNGSDYDYEKEILCQKIIQIKRTQVDKGKLLKSDINKILGIRNKRKMNY